MRIGPIFLSSSFPPLFQSAHFFDIDKIADLQTKLPHMLPTPEFFAESVGKMGISNQDHVVVYDSAGVTSSTRVYWTFQIFGHTRISVLDGGLVKWIAEKRPLESGLKTTSNAVGSRKYTSKFQPQLLKSYQDMVQIVENQSAAIVDARPAPR